MKRNLFFIFSAALLLCTGIVLNSCGGGDSDSDDPVTPSATFSVNPTSISLTGASKGETGSFSITTNSSWVASCDASWLNLSSKSGGSGTVSITVTTTEANQTGATRTATIFVIAGTETKIVTVEQGSPIKTLCMKISDPLTLTESAAFKLTPEGDVFRFYFGYLNANYIGASDDQILSALLQTQGQQTSSTTLYGIENLTPNTEYILCSVAYNKSGERGPIQKLIITTKASVTNRARVTYSNVTYDNSYWYFSTTMGAYAAKYYMLSASGTTAYNYINNCTLAMIAWYINEEVNNGATAIVRDGSWQLPRTSSDEYFFSAAWAVDSNGNWAPTIDGEAGSISSSAKSLMESKGSNTPSIVSIDYEKFLKLTTNSVIRYK